MTENFTTADLIKELQEYRPPAEMRTGGVTVKEWAREQNMGDRNARDQLIKFVEQGILERKWQRCEDGYFRNVYYKIAS